MQESDVVMGVFSSRSGKAETGGSLEVTSQLVLPNQQVSGSVRDSASKNKVGSDKGGHPALAFDFYKHT